MTLLESFLIGLILGNLTWRVVHWFEERQKRKTIEAGMKMILNNLPDLARHLTPSLPSKAPPWYKR